MMAAAEYDAQAAPMHPPIRSRQIATSPISRVMCAVILLPTIASATSAAMLAARGEMAVGSDCSNSEGEWNCMTKSFQRCASGQWSVVMDTANGTICTPSGVIQNFQPAFESSSATSSATCSLITSTTTSVTCSTTKTATPSATATAASEKVSSAVGGTRFSWLALGTIGMGLGAVTLSWLLV